MNQSLRNFIILIGAMMLTLPASASVTGNVGVTSNYLWRGVSQTDDAAAIQGGIDYEHESGFYLGTWASTVDFGDSTSYELDLYGGYSGSIGENFSYDVYYLYYAYPDSDNDIDFGEVSAGISWKWFSLSYSTVVNADNDIADAPLDDDDMSYINAGANFPLSDTLTLSAHYGYFDGDIARAWFDKNSYSNYSLSVNKETELGSFSFMLSDTDLKHDDPKVIIGYNYSFDM